MTLSTDEQRLLRLIIEAGKPVTASDYFRGLNPPPPGSSEEGTEREAWSEKQLALYGAYISLWKQELIEVAVPADGENPDQVVPTAAGLAACV